MTKKKKPTINELAKAVGQNQFAITSVNQVLRAYVEFKGDMIEFQQYLDKKVKENQERIKAEQEKNDA